MFDDRLQTIDWSRFETAYGPAVAVPDQLRRLNSPDLATAIHASHELWCGLCHQQAFISTAALPALPFLLEVLDHAGEELAIEILDIIRGVAVCTIPAWSREPSPDWHSALRVELLREIPRFRKLIQCTNEDISYYAKRIIESLTFKPAEGTQLYVAQIRFDNNTNKSSSGLGNLIKIKRLICHRGIGKQHPILLQRTMSIVTHLEAAGWQCGSFTVGDTGASITCASHNVTNPIYVLRQLLIDADIPRDAKVTIESPEEEYTYQVWE